MQQALDIINDEIEEAQAVFAKMQEESHGFEYDITEQRGIIDGMEIVLQAVKDIKNRSLTATELGNN